MAGTSSRRSLHSRQHSCFYEWLNLQEHDLSELSQSLQVNENHGTGDDLFEHLIQKNQQHFQAYADQRALLSAGHVSPYFIAPWCSSLESSLIYLGGCRPSMSIRLVYVLSGLQVEAFIRQMLEGEMTGELERLSLSGAQLRMIDDLHRRTVRDEEKQLNQMASLQETVADQPFAVIANETNSTSAGDAGMKSPDEAINELERSMGSLLQEADKLRMHTLKEVMNILTPTQGVDLLIATKKLHLSVHRWGQRRDLMHG